MTNSRTLAKVLIKLHRSDNSGELIEDFFDYLRRNDLISLLPQIKSHFKKHMNVLLDKKTLKIYSKYKLSELDLKEIISLVGADNNSIIEMVSDDFIIGGFSAIYNGNIYDGSLRSQITQLSTELGS